MANEQDTVWGFLQFTDGTGLEMEGETLEDIRKIIWFAGHTICGFGEPEIGDEASVCVYLGSSDIEIAVLRDLESIVRLFNGDLTIVDDHVSDDAFEERENLK